MLDLYVFKFIYQPTKNSAVQSYHTKYINDHHRITQCNYQSTVQSSVTKS